MLHYMSISGLFIHSSVNDIRVLSSFQAIVNNARYKCFCGCVFLSVGRCLSMGWLGCMVTQCDPVSICQPVFQGGYTNPCFSTDPLICSMVPAILVGERCCLLVGLGLYFLMTLSIISCGPCYIFFGETFFRLSAHF